MIFIHGGPASPMGYASPYYQKEVLLDRKCRSQYVYGKPKKVLRHSKGYFEQDLAPDCVRVKWKFLPNFLWCISFFTNIPPTFY